MKNDKPSKNELKYPTMKIDRLVELAKPHFESDEEPLSAVEGFFATKTASGGGKRTGIIVATNRRMIFYAKKMGGFDFEAFSYRDLSSITSKKTWMGHHVSFFVSGNECRMKWIQAGDVQELVDLVRERITDAGPGTASEPNRIADSAYPHRVRGPASTLPTKTMESASIETAILRAANASGGVITPAAIAVDGEYTLDECKECLDRLVSKGHAELRVRDTGAIAYAFPDLMATSTLKRVAAADPLSSASPTPAKAVATAPHPSAPPTNEKAASESPPSKSPVAEKAAAVETPPRVQPEPRRTRPMRRRPTRATSKPRWIPAGESVIVAGREIGGMVYVGRGPLVGGEPANAFIDPSKPVAKRADDLHAEGMSYWPNYSSIHPRSRATYLTWLAGDRSDPAYNVGYVFLYFYGLERRFFVDASSREERAAIITEVERLRDAYGSNGSVRNYLGSFLQAARVVIAAGADWDPEFERAGYELPIAVRLAIGSMLQDAKPVPAEWMLSWLMTHPERRLRTPAVRAFPEFKTLFEIRFRERFPSGLKVTKPRRVLSLNYRAASTNFDVDITPRFGESKIPDIANLSRPLDRVAQIADAVTDELDKFSRYIGRNPDGRGTIEAHALLPEPLHALFPCPELDDLQAWVQDLMAQGGLVPVAELIERLEGARPERIGKRHLTGAADALARISIGMAPDPRFALRNPKLGEPVVLFPLPDGITHLEEVSDAYPPALLSLVMGTFVAYADGTVSELEKRHLTERFESSTVLGPSEKARLRANLNWMMTVPPDLGPIRRRLRDVGEELRHGLGRLALAVVGADSVVDPAEVIAIEKLYRILGLETEHVYRELHALATTSEPVTVFRPQTSDTEYAIPAQPEGSENRDSRTPIVLDQERVAAIMADTNHVSNVLHAVFSEDAAEADPAEGTDHTTDQDKRFAGLDARHRGLVEELMRQTSWTPPAFEKLAQQFRLLPAGALETINEWAFQRFGDGLIEEDGDFVVNPDVLSSFAA